MNIPQIFVSTSGTKESSIVAAKGLLSIKNIGIELSGGANDEETVQELQLIHNLGIGLMLHNYFPPPKVPFVFNLASQRTDITNCSINLAKNAIRISSDLGSKYYAVHAGFLIDPVHTELGKPIAKKEVFESIAAIETFRKNIHELAIYAKKFGVKILVENNVLSSVNLKTYQSNFLLMVTPEEIFQMMDLLNEDVGFLLDVGHLKVSGHSLDFDYMKALILLNERVIGYHLSDNEGIADDHLKFNKDSWFLGKLNKNAQFATLEIHSQILEEIQSSINLLKGSKWI